MRAQCGRPSPRTHLDLSFGIISDVQYANIPDGVSFNKIPRYYRASLLGLRSAVSLWRQADVDFCIQLGDIVDGFNPPELAQDALEAVVKEFDSLGRPHYHLLGNHCLYHIPRQVLNRKLRMIGPQGVEGASFYSFCPIPSWRFVVLDGYDVSVLGWPKGHPLHSQATRVLAERNPNEDKNNPTRPAHLPRTERRFVKFGGGLSAEQLSWLRAELGHAREQQQRVLVFCHLALHPATCLGACLLWNYEEVLALVREFTDVCVATFAGHAHQDGSVIDEDGIYHRVLKGVIETPPGEDCCGIIEISENRLDLKGWGLEPVSLTLRTSESGVS